MIGTCDVEKKSSMTVPVWLSHCDRPGHERLVYALLDNQSDTTFCKDETCEALKLDGPKVTLNLSTMFAKNQMVSSTKIRGLMVRGYNSDIKISLPDTYTREIMPADRDHIPTREIAEYWPYLQRITGELLPRQDCEVGLLIGYDCSRALEPRDVIPSIGDGPYALKTDLGWGIVGITKPNHTYDMVDPIGVSHRMLVYEVPLDLATPEEHILGAKEVLISFKTSMKEVVTQMVEQDFSERGSTEIAELSQDDLKFLQIMKNGIHKIENHYEMPLPFRVGEPQLPNNRVAALQRLKQLKSRFKKNTAYHVDYMKFMDNVILSGFAEKVPEADLDQNDGRCWYIPHHGVYNARKPGKIRVVFDCSARYQEVSLNDHLLQGPDLTNALVGVLCRFRQEPIAFICDVEQMFHQFGVNPEHRDFLRFFWWKDGNFESEPVTFRMKVHLFGAVSSPGCANFGLKQVADDYEGTYGTTAANFIRKDFYVDDGLKSVPTVCDALDIIAKSKAMCAEGGLRLHKFVSHSKEIIDSIPVDDRAKGIKNINLLQDTLPVEAALGVQWCIESDTFKFRIVVADKPLTRRGVLSTVSSIYDPLGFIAPVVLVGKQILRSMCAENSDWDSPMPDELIPKWNRWREELCLLEKVSIQRSFKPDDFGAVRTISLHHFSDASTKGYGQCTYIRLQNDQRRVFCSLVMGKSRVAPLKTVTIPRLELTAAVVSVRVSDLLQRELEYEQITEIFWTDSNVVIGYIKNDSRRFRTFVANRVQQIRDHTDPKQWRHVKTEENPADDASRGLTAGEFVNRSKWLTGPDFLWNDELPEDDGHDTTLVIPQDDPEFKSTHVFVTSAAHDDLVRRLDYFSDWFRAKRAVAVCLRLKEKMKAGTVNIKTDCKTTVYRPVGVQEIQEAETVIIKLVQHEVFADELKILCRKPPSVGRNVVLKGDSPLYRLDPFIDEHGIIRVGGRIQQSTLHPNEKHPAVLPRKHHVTMLIIRSCHEKSEHQGRGITLNEIRSCGFWIIRCSSAVSYYISMCVVCRRLRSGVQEQKMADLPNDRLTPSPPFTYCGVDYFGPWVIKEGRKELKRYGVIFTCLASRAIHLETANSLDTSSFINALRRFIAIRGPVRLLRSDRGTNFVGAERELRESLNEMDADTIQRFLTKEGCDYMEFRMNVPSASHMGGVWERQIRTVRSVLASLTKQAGTQLDDEGFRTLMCEVTSIVNSRPLTTDTLNDPMSLKPLTPNQLLTMKSSIILPPPGVFQAADVYSRKRWRRVQFLADLFWTRWRKEYLQALQPRQRWNRQRRDLEEGDLVLIKDENIPRNDWRLAQVDEVYHADDNHVRKVKLAIADRFLDATGKRLSARSYLERPIQKLVLLLEAERPEIPRLGASDH